VERPHPRRRAQLRRLALDPLRHLSHRRGILGPQPQPHGRLFELTNPLTATPGGATLLHRNAVARVSHEGPAFDTHNNLYYIDETNGGSIYRFASATPTTGATFLDAGTNAVLRVGSGATANATGAATWLPFTTAAGTGLPGAVTITDPNGVTAVDARATTDVAAFKGTDYQRPEDLAIQTLPNGDQLLYVATTTTNEVYSINLATKQVQRFVDRTTIDEATGLPVGAALTSPDNLAIDAAGNLYIVEDQPGGQADIWFARDANRDGVAESVARWMTMATIGAEPSGLYLDITNPNIAFINVQHPSSGVDRMIELSALPEPGAAALLGAALGVLGLARARRVAAETAL
jgi:secreted PhoX family phosphatase